MELLNDKMRVWLQNAKFVKPHPGVYVLYNRAQVPIYIGETSNMEEQFTKYVDTDFEGDPCKQKTSSYQRMFTTDSKKIQQDLIHNFRKKTGDIPACNSPPLG